MSPPRLSMLEAGRKCWPQGLSRRLLRGAPDDVEPGPLLRQRGRDEAGEGGEHGRHAKAAHALQYPALQLCNPAQQLSLVRVWASRSGASLALTSLPPSECI